MASASTGRVWRNSPTRVETRAVALASTCRSILIFDAEKVSSRRLKLTPLLTGGRRTPSYVLSSFLRRIRRDAEHDVVPRDLCVIQSEAGGTQQRMTVWKSNC